jgi:sugar/nucleoside kinase (ribokinase family)
MTPPRLVVLDSVMIDVTVRVSELPARGSDRLSSDALVTTGGGFTVATAARRHGLVVVYAGKLGTGPLSEVARSALRREDVATPVDPDPDHDAGFCLVIVDDGGERTFITAKGAELTLTGRDLEAVALEAGDYLYLSGYNLVYPEIAEAVARWVGEVDPAVVVAYDPGARAADVAPDHQAAVLARSDWLLCNAAEARVLSGEAEIAAAAEGLLARTGRAGVVIHDGERGCWVVTPLQPCVRVEGFAAHVIDTNGAGDTHNGVFLAETALGTGVLEAARRANAAAAIAVGRLGPATSPTRDELTAWFARFVP